jgi:hypothetical protein
MKESDSLSFESPCNPHSCAPSSPHMVQEFPIHVPWCEAGS